MVLLVISELFFDNLYMVFSVFIIYKPLKLMIENELLKKKKREFLIQFKDLLYNLSSSIATGRGMKEALQESQVQLSYVYKKDDLIIATINVLLEKMNSENAIDSDVIMEFAADSKLDDVIQFANMYDVCKKSGANLVIAMNKGAEVIGEKISAENEIKMYLSQKKTEGRMMMLMPFLMVAFMKYSGEGYFNIMYVTLIGRLIMLASLISMVLVYLIVERIVQIEI